MSPPPSVTPTRHYNAAIDLLKGLAILGVLWQHAVPPRLTDSILGNVWIRPAVPVFFILLGMNMAGSLNRRGRVHFTPAFLADYGRRRLARIAVPFLVVLAAGYVIAIAMGTLHASSSLPFGALPINAPGNYFLTAMIAFVILLPFIVWAFQRHPLATLLACIALDVAYEALVHYATLHGPVALSPARYVYQANPLRWLVLVALGVWAASDDRLESPRNRPLLLLAPLSLAYLVLLQVRPEWFTWVPGGGFLAMTNVLAAPWAFLVVLAGLRWLPSERPTARAGRGLVALGRGSYHIYLIQMLWMGVVVDALWSGIEDDVALRTVTAPIDFAACIALGWLYYLTLPGTRLQLPGRPGGRRTAPEPS